MRKILLSILLLLFLQGSLCAQGYIDVSDWFVNDYESEYPGETTYLGFWEWSSWSTGPLTNAVYFFSPFPAVIDLNEFSMSTTLTPVTFPSAFAGSVLIDVDGVSVYVFRDGRATLVINRGGREYRANVPLVNEGTREFQILNFRDRLQYWSFPRIAPTAESLALLDSMSGSMPEIGDIDFESVLLLLQRLVELNQEQKEQLDNLVDLLPEQLELLQYIIGMSAFIGGILLAYVLVFGMRH